MAESMYKNDMVPEEPPAYEAQDAISSSIQSAVVAGSGGFLMAAVQNTVQRQNVGAFGVISKFGGTTATFTAVGATYGFVSTASANLREKDDFWAQVHGGAAGGAVLGLKNRSMPSAMGNALMFGAVLGMMAFTGGTIFGQRSTEPDMDKAAYKEEMRRRHRRPINELVNEIGEGRGIYPPGYPERRRERVKAAYGIDVAEQPYYKGISASNHP